MLKLYLFFTKNQTRPVKERKREREVLKLTFHLPGKNKSNPSSLYDWTKRARRQTEREREREREVESARALRTEREGGH